MIRSTGVIHRLRHVRGLGRGGVSLSSYNFPPSPSPPPPLPLPPPIFSPPLTFRWIIERSGVLALRGFCLPSCPSQKPCCLSLHRKDDFLLSKNKRGCPVSFSPDSNYKGPIAIYTDITSDLFKPFPLTITTFSIRDENICSFWVKEQPDYSFIRKRGHSLLQSNWLTGFGIRECKSLTVCVAPLLSQ